MKVYPGVMSPAEFLTPGSSKWRALLTYPRLGDRAKVLLCWLVFAADPRSGAVEPVTQAEIATEFGWSTATVSRSLAALVDAGMVDAHFPRGGHRGGHVRVLAYYDVMRPTRWLNRQRAIGARP